MAAPLCRYFSKCGGCTAQHIDYPSQLEYKKRIMSKAIDFGNIEVFSGKEYGYRNRLDMLFYPKGIGLREKENPSKIVGIDKCEIANSQINELILEIKSFFKEADIKTFMYAVLRASELDNSISFVLNESSTKLSSAIEKIKEFAKTTKAKNVIVTYSQEESTSLDSFAVKGNEILKEKYLGKTFYYSAQGFFQNNHEIAEKMHHYCNALLKKHDTKNAHLLDLYAGVGTFGIINSELFKNVSIVESFKPAIECTEKNIKENNAKNAKAYPLQANQIGRLKINYPLFLITDPPRSGMCQKTIEKIQEIKPEVIIYVSCNAAQLGKDIKKFKKYKIKSAALFDMFPQTPHMESVVELCLRDL